MLDRQVVKSETATIKVFNFRSGNGSYLLSSITYSHHRTFYNHFL